MERSVLMLLLLTVSYTNAQPAGSLPGNPVITFSPVSSQVVLLTINERFDTTGCYDPKRYSLQSAADPDYQTVTQPVRIGRHSFVKGLTPSDEPSIVFELYLIFEKPLKNSSSYHLLVDNIIDTDGNAASLDTTFIFSDAEILGNVKANEVGYLPESPKLGKLGRFLGDAWFMPIDTLAPPAFQVIGENQQVAFNGTCQYLRSDSAFSGEIVFEMDFSALETPGKYYVYIPGYGRSEVFTIASDCYDTLYFNTARALYYQRSEEIEAAYGGVWAREGLPAQTAQIHASHLNSPLYSASDYPPGTELPIHGGWLDAGDYGRYVPTAASALFIMFTAFEIYPQKFPDNHLDIPESGNGIPDWLDEARYETDWLLQMQAPDGGVYFRVTPATWSQGLPGEEQNTLYISEKTTQSTALFAAAMAMAARNFKNFDAAYAALCLEKARNAWTFLKSHTTPTPPVNMPGISAGPYPDPIDADNRAWAAAELYKTTGEAQYNADFNEWYGQIPHQFHATMSWQQHTFKAAWAYATTTFNINNAFVDEFKNKLTNEVLVNYYNRTMKIHAYHGAYHHFKGYVGYGSFGMAQSYAFDYIMFAHLLQKQELLDYAKIQVDIPLGNNPLAQCFITGASVHSPMYPLHWSTVPGQYAQPVPGVPVFGPAASLLMNRLSSFVIQDSLNRYPYGYKKEDPYPVLRRYTDARQAVEMSEFTVQEIAVTAAVFAYLSSVVTNPLPVRLKDFSVKAENCKVRLDWSTSEEVNASHFSVQRSKDARNFHEIGRIEASGSPNTTSYYHFEDSYPDASNYYRLQITDNDSTHENSAMRFIKLPCKQVEWVIIPVGYPVYEIHIENASDGQNEGYTGELYNCYGRKILEVTMAQNFTFNVSRLPAGVYVMRLRTSAGEDLGRRKLLIF
ncbi:glycoside hydrolase family 9 protein [Dyadobacter jiangsuensis]|uniref:Cellulase-like Ig domain-containing protein n=1 Tax=Dyadobacter jiangsuensis TaxID=1591085 RepID=A0A2P8FXY2_9BACT|nr:glycoside hydrolase family 9 protein [Dyadobacter jiangsuensis]PSL26576.1 cellulase-like Ig domain-containing protein [Dyadobacter jiangsuensis]